MVCTSSCCKNCDITYSDLGHTHAPPKSPPPLRSLPPIVVRRHHPRDFLHPAPQHSYHSFGANELHMHHLSRHQRYKRRRSSSTRQGNDDDEDTTNFTLFSSNALLKLNLNRTRLQDEVRYLRIRHCHCRRLCSLSCGKCVCWLLSWEIDRFAVLFLTSISSNPQHPL